MNRYLKLLIIFTLSLIIYSCSEDLVDNPVENKAPETNLFLYPDSTVSQQPSKLQVNWWGDDPDGIIVGFYFKWEGIDNSWTFTTKNDSTFALPIGTADTNYVFKVSAVDNSGNGKYDNSIVQNGIDYGPEPFIDANGNDKFDNGETYFDIGLIDPTPAEQSFPIKNSTPVLTWNPLTVLPDTSFPVMTFAWSATDLDGDESIVNINIALNDTTNYVSLDGLTTLVTLRVVDLNAANPEMEILINGSDQNIFTDNLQGLKLNDNNIIYIQAQDISGAKTNFIPLPDSGKSWFVKKPKGKFLVIDDFNLQPQINTFYIDKLNSINGGSLTGNYELYDFKNSPLPFENVTFPETIKLFDYIFWYASTQPNVNLLSLITNNFLNSGGKLMLSMTLEDPSSTFSWDLATLRSFIPIDSLSMDPVDFLFAGANINSVAPNEDYPDLVNSLTVGAVRAYYPSITAQNVYRLESNKLTGPIGFITNEKNLFFIGMPLHLCDGGDMNVDTLLEKVLIEEFGIQP